jgi:hypothetical protein
MSKSKGHLITRQAVDDSHNLKVKMVPSLKLLGVYLNNKLNWDTHVEFLRVTCSRRLHILRRLRGLIPRSQLNLVYESIVRSLLDYACPVFTKLNKKNSKTLQNVENRAHKIIAFGSTEGITNYGTVEERRKELARRLWLKIESNDNHILCSLMPHKLSRSQKYFLECCRTDKLNNSFFPLMARLFNNNDVTR